MSEVRDQRGICKCGCHADSHFDKTGRCLRCPDTPKGEATCRRFRDPSSPDSIPPRPNHIWHCMCTRCLPYAAQMAAPSEEEAPATDPYPTFAGPIP